MSIAEDLVRHCPRIASDAALGELVWQFNYDLIYGHTTWNTDLAIGPPPPQTEIPEPGPLGMAKANPSTVRIAVEIKGVMTEHRKAIKNRKRDLEAHHAHVHNYDSSTIAGGVIVINASPTFLSPLRGGALTTHRNPADLVTHCVNEVGNISATGGTNQVGLDAVAALVVDMSNVERNQASFLIAPPAPQVGHPAHWDSFIQRICNAYVTRFAKGD
ncbi:MAG: hypothetical protein ABR507_05925 [Actinomycetota bacterium]|nr:hypothetical protein [Actinomycetota bacterium]